MAHYLNEWRLPELHDSCGFCVRRSAAFFVLAALVLTAGIVRHAVAAAMPLNMPAGAAIDVFYAQDCEHCKRLEEEYFAPLEARGVTIARFEISESESAKVLLAIQTLPEFKAVSIDSQGDLPLVFAGRYALEGERAVCSNLPRVFEMGGPVLSAFPHERAAEAIRRGEIEAPKSGPGDVPIYMAYFENPGCSNCAAVNILLSIACALHPGLRVEHFNIDEDASRLLLEAAGARLAVPEEKRLVTPAVFVGADFLLEEFDREALMALLAKYEKTGAPPFWRELGADKARTTIMERFQSMGLAAVTLAGLADGVNPCAFATIVFMVVYLAGTGMNRGRVLAAGIAFTAAVFLAYFGMGVGAFGAIRAFVSNRWIGDGLLLAGGALALVFGALSLRDYLVARREGLKSSVLRLSGGAASKIRLRISRFARSRWVIPGAFLSGLAISLVEVVCTGQVYLPTIVFVSRQSDTRWAGLSALLVYNAAFVLPMAAIFLMVFLGVKTQKVAGFVERHLAKAKLALSAVFLGLGALLATLAIGK